MIATETHKWNVLVNFRENLFEVADLLRSLLWSSSRPCINEVTTYNGKRRAEPIDCLDSGATEYKLLLPTAIWTSNILLEALDHAYLSIGKLKKAEGGAWDQFFHQPETAEAALPTKIDPNLAK